MPGLLTTANLLLTLHGGFQGPRREMLFSEVMPAVARGDADLGVIIHEGVFCLWGIGPCLAAVFSGNRQSRAGRKPEPRVFDTCTALTDGFF